MYALTTSRFLIFTVMYTLLNQAVLVFCAHQKILYSIMWSVQLDRRGQTTIHLVFQGVLLYDQEQIFVTLHTENGSSLPG